MNLLKRFTALFLSVLILVSACSSVPITGRRQLKIVSDAAIIQMSLKEYSNFLKENKLSENKKEAQMVVSVGRRIQEAVEEYFSERGISDLLEGYQWEFNLVEGEEINAWCMPGGKVVVYTGLLPVTQDEAGLAVVMGHEIAHAVANHGGERMSQALVAQMGRYCACGRNPGQASTDSATLDDGFWFGNCGWGDAAVQPAA